VLVAAGLAERVSRRPTVSALVSSNRPGQLEHVVATVGAQRDVDVELLVLGHGFEVDPDVVARARELGLEHVQVLHAPASESLGSCLNRLVAASSGEVVAKMDDDDLYGPNYLSDQLHALDYSGAALVGKQAHHMYLEAQHLTIVRFPEREHRFTDFVMGPTIMTGRDVALAHPFGDLGRGEDTDFLRRVAADGLPIYSSDRYNFVQMRYGSAHHTWEASSAELLANARVHSYGRVAEHVMI
jgi:glycosyltransferase involved in cell wall biosynthesis